MLAKKNIVKRDGPSALSASSQPLTLVTFLGAWTNHILTYVFTPHLSLTPNPSLSAQGPKTVSRGRSINLLTLLPRPLPKSPPLPA